jgi:cytochrome c553
MQPSKHYAWIRMPTFNLKEDEAKAIAAFALARNKAGLPRVIPPGDAAKGKALVAANGCANCHKLGDVAPVAMPKLADIGKDVTKGCLATDDGSRGKAPDFAFEGAQVSALRAFLGSDRASLKRRDPAEFAERRISALHCNACHERDGQEPRLAAISALVDQLVGELPPEEAAAGGENGGEAGGAASNNPRPLLTFTGDKLRPEWMAKFIAGHQPYRTRPWLNMRMPFFTAGAELLAQGMQHGMPPATPADPAPANDWKADGETLLGPNGGFACSQCHGIGAAPPVAVFEAPGINLGYAAQRLQKDYFQRWMLNPLRFDPVTRMPKFAQDDGTTPLSGVLGGKAMDQFEAVWQYLNDVNKKTDFPH